MFAAVLLIIAIFCGMILTLGYGMTGQLNWLMILGFVFLVALPLAGVIALGRNFVQTRRASHLD